MPRSIPRLHAQELTIASDFGSRVEDSEQRKEIIEALRNHEIFIWRNAVDRSYLLRLREYLTQIGRASLPNYQPIAKGCPNFHRLNHSDPRAYVRGHFHQFVFFPWNQDLFDCFDAFRPIFRVKNLLSSLEPEKFLGAEPEDGCTSRLAFQFYPAGKGYLNHHADPVDYHQLVVPTLTMSRKGSDYREGGAYVDMNDGRRVCLDDVTEIGDVAFFNASQPHGVAPIDENAAYDPLAFQGRWMLLLAVNKLFDNPAIANSSDLQSRG